MSSKYVNPTGDGYLGVHSVGANDRNPEVYLSADETREIGIEPGQKVPVIHGDGRLILKIEAEDGDDVLARLQATPSDRSPKSRAGTLCLRYVEKIGLSPGDDARIYHRNGALVVVPRESDPFVGGDET